MKTCLITGCTGQDGSFLSELLLSKDYKVYGMIRRSSVNTHERLKNCLYNRHFELVNCDLTDATGIHRLISNIKPDECYNLGAMSHVGISFNEPVSTFNVDAVGPLNLLEAIRQSSPKTKFYQASSSELFGDTKIYPQNESTPFMPRSPYGVAKLAAYHSVKMYREAYDIFACNGILFNHCSTRRGENFVTRKITRYLGKLVVAIENKIDFEKLHLGNLDAKRDWSSAQDMVRGMWMMLQQDQPKDYVLASEQTRTIKEFLHAAFSSVGLDYKKFVVVDPKFYRPADVNLLYGDCTKAKNELGWTQKISFVELVSTMVRHDINLARKEFVQNA